MYPIEKYKFYTNGTRVIAVSTYAGRTVRGVAICHDGDEFSLEKGKELAALRCDEKVARKRLARAKRKVEEARRGYINAKDHFDKMINYKDDAAYNLAEVVLAKKRLLSHLK